MPESASHTAEQLAADLTRCIQTYGSCAVAFSGGVDSAVVAKAAAIALSDKAIAITAVSPSLAASELEIARAEAAAIGIRHIEIQTDEFQRPEYQQNAGDRCFYCKETLYSVAQSKLTELGVTCMANGANTDDQGDHRPGMQAARDFSVRSPLIEAGLNKLMVRQLARHWNLSVAEKPAAPCLSSRIAYGVKVTPDRVRRIEAAEAFLRQHTALSEFRVRLEADDLARVEVPVAALGKFVSHDFRAALIAEFRRIGFRRVTLDLEGFRSGSLNDALPIVELSAGT